jgi:hypothetical protein
MAPSGIIEPMGLLSGRSALVTGGANGNRSRDRQTFPGFVATRMSIVDGRNELESEWFRDVYVKYGKLPLRRAAQPEEIAAHVAWLASEENSYLTGQVVTVDGGLTVTF